MSNTLSFDRIQQGLDSISNVGTFTDTFEIQGRKITIRTLGAEEKRKVDEYANNWSEEKGYSKWDEINNKIDMMLMNEFFRVRKIETLSYAIQKIDSIDFKGYDYIETGEKLKNGKPEKKPKHIFLRETLNTWNSSVIDACHKKYSDLLTLSETEVGENLDFMDPEDELERVENKRKVLLRQLGREDEIQENKPQSVEMPREDEAEDNLRDTMFSTIEDEETKRQILEGEKSLSDFIEPEETLEENQQKETSNDQEVTNNQEKQNENEEESDEYLMADNKKFTRLDDPEEPYTEEEIQYLEEQEKLLKEREDFGQSQNPQDPIMDEEQVRQRQKEAQQKQQKVRQNQQENQKRGESQALLNKRRGNNEPLNQKDAKIQKGDLPSEQMNHGPAEIHKTEKVDPDDLPMAEGYDEGAEHLSPKENNQRSEENNEPRGNKNPHYQGHRNQ